MAFTAAQKHDIRKFLGASAAYFDLNTQLESMMDTIGADADAQALVETILAELITVDAALATTGASSATYGSLKQVDEVQFYPTDDGSETSTVGALKRGRMLVRRLAQRIAGSCWREVIQDDYFATSLTGITAPLRLG